jgi:hypothetical protein
MPEDLLDRLARANPTPEGSTPPPYDRIYRQIIHTDNLRHGDAEAPDRRGSRLRHVRSAWTVAVPVGAVALVVAVIVLVGHAGTRQSTTPHPRSSDSRLEVPRSIRELTSILGVLRRPQTGADRDPKLIRQMRRQSLIFGSPVLSLMRLATVAPWGQPIYVVPFLPPDKQALSRVPSLRHAGNIPKTAAVWTYPINPGSSLGVPAEIQGGRYVTNMAWVKGVKQGPAANRWVMVVPDGVAKVALWQATGSISQHPKRPTKPGAKPIIVAVQDNIAAFIAHGFTGPGQEVWYGPDGHIVKRIANANSCGPPLGNCA